MLASFCLTPALAPALTAALPPPATPCHPLHTLHTLHPAPCTLLHAACACARARVGGGPAVGLTDHPHHGDGSLLLVIGELL